ncbi:hypothetical protein V499_00036 [Pseudogymnoascus sp. VKM F-103]|nr:hypothetical protein V499_00036 [Pseudogymnoascus sp. VKM F-103]
MANSVFATPKLLSLILSFLEIRDLLVSAQLVNRTWNSVIAATASLQIALFFKATAFTVPRFINPLLKEIFPLWFEPPSLYSRTHPRSTALDFQQLAWAQRAPAFQRCEASWRKMLVVSGGVEIRGLKITWRMQNMLGWQESRGMLACEDGLRMGVLWDLTKDFCVSHENASFMMNWPEKLFLDKRREVVPAAEIRWKDRLQRMFRRKERAQEVRTLSARPLSLSMAQVDAVSEFERGTCGEEQVLEMVFTSANTCQPREWDAAPVLGPEFQSAAYQKVTIEYGQPTPCSDP